MIHSDSPFCEIVSRKNYFTTEIGHYGFFISSTSFYNSPRRKFIDIIKEKGFSEIEEAYTTTSHTVWKDAKDRIIDLHIFEFNEKGYLIFEGETYPSSVFSGIGKIGDKVVKCIGAEDQVLFHLGYEHDENDVHDVRLLCERFNIPIPNEYK